MKNKILILLVICLLSSDLLFALDIRISPQPQELNFSTKVNPLPQSYVIEGMQEVDPATIEWLQTYFDQPTDKSKFKITIGKRGDKSVESFTKEIPDNPEGYYLKTSSKEIVIAGSDARGTFYGVQSLLQLIQNDSIPEVVIRDYPDIPFRGVVEGFYGTPWSFEDRIRQIDFYGKNKLNTYIYGPKDDPYHSSPYWRDPYPEAEANKIKQMVNASVKNKVDFVWAIHPGKDIQWNDTDKEAILNKFENMYQLGVRSFAVFFDDISGIGTDPKKQAELLNFLDNQFVSQKKDVTPLIMCPTEYNKSWSNPAKGYLKTLGTKLNPSIHIMWTGDRVIAEITEPSVEWINKQIDRPAYIWWNFPVSDYVRDHLLMGRVYGNDLTIGDKLSGFVANPMERAEASKIALFSVADYTWNLKTFESQKSWENSIRSLMPESYLALYKFSQHNSDLGQNGHGFRREESVDIAPVAKSILKILKRDTTIESSLRLAFMEEMREMQGEFETIVEAANILLASDDNNILIKEIEPWIYQFKNLGETGQEIIKMHNAYIEKDWDEFVDKYNYIKTLRKINYSIDKAYNQNPYQPGIKTGSLILQPFIDDMFAYLVVAYNKQFNTSLNSVLSYQPCELSGTVTQMINLPVQSKLNRLSIAPVNEIVQWNKDQYIQIELDKESILQVLKINLEPLSQETWMKIEISTDGKNWKNVKIAMDRNPLEIMLNPVVAKYLKFTNIDKDREVSFKGLSLTVDKSN